MSFNKYFLLALSSNREESVLNTCASNSSQKQFYLTERNTPRGLETCSCFRVFDCGTRVWELSGRTVRVRIVIETLVSKHHEIHEIQNGLKTSLSLSLPLSAGVEIRGKSRR